MRINETNRVGGIDPYRRQNDTKQALGQAKKSKQKDEVQISPEAKELLNGVKNDDKIERLKQEVSTGTYQVDARKVAEKLWPFIK